MGHQKWVLIGNKECIDFKDKLHKTQEAVLDVLGKSAGAHFHKKYLLQKDKKADPSAIPLDLSSVNENCFEEIYVQETLIDFKTSEGEVI